MIEQLHAGIACLLFVCWDSMSSFAACDWLVNNGCFNPIGVNSIIALHTRHTGLQELLSEVCEKF